MLYTRVNQYEVVSCRVEREILIFKGTAVKSDETSLAAEYRSELVHYAALDTAVVVLRGLSYLGKFELVNASVGEHGVQGECEHTLESCR